MTGDAAPTAAQQRAARDAKVLELRRAGATFDAIAKAVGLANKGSAQKAYKRALERTGGPEMDRDLARVQEIDRLDRLLTAVWPAAMKGDLQAVRQALQISRHRTYVLGLALTPTRIASLEDLGSDRPGSDNVVPPSVLAKMRKELQDVTRAAGST